MKYVYLVFEYQPKYKYGAFITEGHYKHQPKVFATLKAAKKHQKEYKHASYRKKVKLYEI